MAFNHDGGVQSNSLFYYETPALTDIAPGCAHLTRKGKTTRRRGDAATRRQTLTIAFKKMIFRLEAVFDRHWPRR